MLSKLTKARTAVLALTTLFINTICILMNNVVKRAQPYTMFLIDCSCKIDYKMILIGKYTCSRWRDRQCVLMWIFNKYCVYNIIVLFVETPRKFITARNKWIIEFNNIVFIMLLNSIGQNLLCFYTLSVYFILRIYFTFKCSILN